MGFFSNMFNKEANSVNGSTTNRAEGKIKFVYGVKREVSGSTIIDEKSTVEYPLESGKVFIDYLIRATEDMGLSKLKVGIIDSNFNLVSKNNPPEGSQLDGTFYIFPMESVA